MNSSGYRDVDCVITVREVARMIKQTGLNLAELPEEECDSPLGVGTGAGTIFGATGGVMEAALRTVYEVVTGKTLENVEFTAVRGMEGIKEASVDLNGTEVKVAVVHTLANAKKMMDKVRAGQADYAFIEIMACPGGCVGGGGTPIVNALTRSILPEDYRAIRGKGLYNDDKNLPLRKSHENPFIKAVYAEYLGEPLSHKSHELLHTTYTPRVKYRTDFDK